MTYTFAMGFPAYSPAKIGTPEAFRPDMWCVTAEKIVQTVFRIVEAVHPLQVIAFGSRARGDHRPDSDLDLAVITEGIPDGTRFGGKPPYTSRPVGLGCDMPLDLLYITSQRQSFMKDSFLSVEHQIAKDGLLLYDHAGGAVDTGVAGRLAR